MYPYEVFLRGVVVPWYVQNQTYEPYPIISTNQNLEGDVPGTWTPWPQTVAIENGKWYRCSDLGVQEADQYYIYVPTGWTVTSRESEAPNFTRHRTGAGYVVVGIENGSRVTQWQFNRAPWSTTQIDMCTGKIDSTWDGGVFRHLMPHQPECDATMLKYCDKPENKLSGICNCIREKEDWRNNHPNELVQVTCLGAKCGEEGYRTGPMMKEGCTIEYCGQFIDSQGSNINIKGQSTIKCGGVEWDPKTLTAKSQIGALKDDPDASTGFDIYTWIFLGASVLIWGAVLFIILRFT